MNGYLQADYLSVKAWNVPVDSARGVDVDNADLFNGPDRPAIAVEVGHGVLSGDVRCRSGELKEL